MKITALLFTVLTGLSFASISIIVGRLAKDRISFFQFFTLSNLIASAAAWALMPTWSLVPGIEWGKVLLITGSIGLVNTASQAALVCSMKWGHNGLSVAIRNTASMISMLFALIFLHEKISVINAFGVLVVIVSLAVIAIFGKKNSVSSDLKKWIPAVIGSLLLSGTYQILMTSTVILPETTRKAKVIVPCLMGFCCIGNLIASLIEQKIRNNKDIRDEDDRKLFHFDKKVWQVLFCWVAGALIQYYLLLRALSSMREAAMASLAWPMLIGVNVTTFSIFCRLRWKEKYPLTTIIGMVGCVAGIIMMIIGRK